MAFLPYGSDDSSVVFRHPLTRDITDDGGDPLEDITNTWTNFVIQGDAAGPDTDPILGTIGRNPADTADSAYRMHGYIGASLNAGFDFSIEVQAAWLTRDSNNDFPGSADNGSEGYNPATQETLLSAISANNTFQNMLRKRDAGGGFLARALVGNAAIDNDFLEFTEGVGVGDMKINSWGRDEFVTINIGVGGDISTGGTVYIGINGYPQYTTVVTVAGFDEVFNFFDLLSNLGNAGTFVSSHYARNVQIAARAVTFTGALPDKLGVLSDSISDDALQSTTMAYDNNFQYAFQRKLWAEQDAFMPSIDVDENPGFGISDNVPVGQLKTRLATVLALLPTKLVICGGTNDILINASYDSVDFEAEYKDLIERSMGVNSNPATTVEFIVLCTPPPLFSVVASVPQQSNQASVLSIINSLPAWFKSTYPGAGDIGIIDNWKNMGADNAKAEHIVGQFQNTLGGTHLSSDWNRIYGEGVFTALFVEAGVGGIMRPIISDIMSPITSDIMS